MPLAQPYVNTAQTRRFDDPRQSRSMQQATPSDAQQGMESPDYQNVMSWYKSFLPVMAPALTQAQNQYNELGASIPGIQAQVQTGIGQTQQQAGLEQAQLGLSGQQLDIQGGALARQFQLQPQLYGLQTQGYENAGQTLQRNLGAARQTHAMNENDIEAQGVTGGSLFTAGHRQLEGREKLSFDQQIAGLRDQQKQLGLTKQGSALGFAEQMAQLQDSQKNLDILHKRLGISGQEITNRTEQAIQQMGLNGMVSVSQIHKAMVDASNGMITPFSSILGQFFEQSGLRPTAATPAP